MVKNVVVHLKIVISGDTFKFFKLVNAIDSGKSAHIPLLIN